MRNQMTPRPDFPAVITVEAMQAASIADGRCTAFSRSNTPKCYMTWGTFCFEPADAKIAIGLIDMQVTAQRIKAGELPEETQLPKETLRNIARREVPMSSNEAYEWANRIANDIVNGSD